ncbi:lipopolysaccharide biosynthesis protein [Peribacillus frigoritolerans]|uniref:lipopolysaccharide biosynthesis protein n=1 Tax=Peribacillus frigoritolerans TaxID=450367 RepID=UPI00203F5972|nr:lipopolysaccharide biosynthesis protein [Peribacillus frigoritolerans]MCM3166359.1 lipopolysaccharide biosynthesis protein [Peribacillus frigoritolerans]
MNNKELKGNMINAAKWSSITEIAAKIVTPITNMILARILAPEAFGVVATITMIISFADMFTDAGFQKYLVQREFKDIKEKYQHSNVAFWTNLGMSFLLWGIIALFSEPIAVLVGNPGLGIVITVACVQLPLTSFSSIQMALYRREFNFKALFWARLISIFLPFVVTIPLAFIGLDYWSLIIGTICGGIANAIILTIKSNWKPKWFYCVNVLKKMLSFSIWSLFEAISIWLTVWIDVFIISIIFNEYYLGLYKTSTIMVNSLLALVTSATTPILFSALSRLQKNDEEFNQTFFNMQRIIAIFILPLGIGIYLYDELAVQILLGNQWKEASRIIGIWALTSAITIVFGHYCSEVYRAKGRPKLSFLAQILHLVVLVPVCIISGKYGFWIFILARSWVRMQAILVHFIIMKYVIKFPVRKMISNVCPAAISAVAMGFLGYFLQLLNEGIIWSFVSIFICVILYFSFLLSFPQIRRELLGIIKRVALRL